MMSQKTFTGNDINTALNGLFENISIVPKSTKNMRRSKSKMSLNKRNGSQSPSKVTILNINDIDIVFCTIFK